jgi:hypothetical protein
MDLATLDLKAALKGKVRERRLAAELLVEDGATIRLPRKAPRALQPLEGRPDILIGPPPAAPEEAAPADAERAGLPLGADVHLKFSRLSVKSDQPRLNVELRSDSTWAFDAGPLRAGGSLDVVQGTIEPMSARIFKVVRGHVALSGGPLEEGQLDLAADWETPTAKVHAVILVEPVQPLHGAVHIDGLVPAGIAQQGAATMAAMAPGVSAALSTTVAGLLVAIPSMFAYNWLVHNLRAFTVELDNFAQELVSKMETEFLGEE